MRKLLLILGFYLSFSTLKAQSVEETVEWLNAKKVEIKYPKNNTTEFQNIEITADYLKIYEAGERYARGFYLQVPWARMKEIRKKDTYEILIICDWKTDDGQTGYVSLTVKDIELRDKIIKALKHMATLKGAKLIDSDLF